MHAVRALGVRLYKPSPKDWAAAAWAVVGEDRPGVVVAHGICLPPKAYGEAEALRHTYEAVAAAVQENAVGKTLVWQIENNARLNAAMRPRLRAEGAVCAAAAMLGSSVELVAWREIATRASAELPKEKYAKAEEVCGIAVGGADNHAVLVAVAALAS